MIETPEGGRGGGIPSFSFFCHSSFFSDANGDDEGEAVLSRFFGSPAEAMVKDRR